MRLKSQPEFSPYQTGPKPFIRMALVIHKTLLEPNSLPLKGSCFCFKIKVKNIALPL